MFGVLQGLCIAYYPFPGPQKDDMNKGFIHLQSLRSERTTTIPPEPLDLLDTEFLQETGLNHISEKDFEFYFKDLNPC